MKAVTCTNAKLEVTHCDDVADVVVVGVGMGADRFLPSMPIVKEVDLRFVLGYTSRAERRRERPSTRWAIPRRTPRSRSTPRATPQAHARAYPLD